MHTTTLPTVGLMLALVGCSTPPTAPAPLPAAPSIPSPKPKELPPDWVLQDRYTLTRTQPTLEQREPLYQLINVQIAPAQHASVGDALRHVLQRSGYSLCPESPAVTRLFSRPLPAVHQHLGPVSLLDALTIIGGPSWQVEIDPVERIICYALRLPPPAPPRSLLEIAR